MGKLVFKKLVLVALLSMVIPATGFAADTIKIGIAGPHSGDLAAYGIPTLEAAQMVAAQVNAAGGVLGKQVEVLPMDDQCKPEIATNAATKLASRELPPILMKGTKNRGKNGAAKSAKRS